MGASMDSCAVVRVPLQGEGVVATHRMRCWPRGQGMRDQRKRWLTRRFNEQAQQASGPSIDLHCGFVPVALSRSIVERGGDLIAARLG